jgi:SAM-dependent methyltransferase
MLAFDEKTTRFLDDAYQGRDATRRRRANFEALDPRPGETILDLGCGNGLLTQDLARAVGPTGRVLGLDASTEMLQAAGNRCDGRDNVRLERGVADALPYGDASIDKAVSVQVFEYFADMRPALAELARVLRPGGRLVIGDLHWDTLIWSARDQDRADLIRRTWESHLADLRVPQRLPDLLPGAGLAMVRMIPETFCDVHLRPDGVAQMMMHLMSAWAVEHGALTRDQAQDWQAEQAELAAQGRFFFSITHFVCVARVV